MKERFLIEDYIGVKGDEDPKVKIVEQDELWKIIQSAVDVDKLPKIAVYKIGECVLDWS